MFSKFDEKQRKIVRDFALSAQNIGNDALGKSLENLTKFLQKKAHKAAEVDARVAMSEFAYNLEEGAIKASIASDPLRVFGDFAQNLKAAYNKKNYDTDELNAEMHVLINRAKIGMIPRVQSEALGSIFKNASTAMQRVTSSSFNIPSKMVDETIDAIKQDALSALGIKEKNSDKNNNGRGIPIYESNTNANYDTSVVRGGSNIDADVSRRNVKNGGDNSGDVLSVNSDGAFRDAGAIDGIDSNSDVVKDNSDGREEILQAIEIQAQIAKAIARIENDSRLGTVTDLDLNIPLLHYTPPYLSDKQITNTTDLRVLQIKNPLLALAYLRIRGGDDVAASNLLQKISKVNPNSPEIPYLNIARTKRLEMLKYDPLQFGEDQGYIPREGFNFYPIADETSEVHKRLDSAVQMHKLFGTSAFYKKQEIEQLKSLDSAEKKAAVFAANKDAVRVYNLKNKNAQFNPMFLEADLNEIDSNLNNYMGLAKNFSTVRIEDYPIIEKAVEEGQLKNIATAGIRLNPGAEPYNPAFNMTPGFVEKLKLLALHKHLVNPDIAGPMIFMRKYNEIEVAKISPNDFFTVHGTYYYSNDNNYGERYENVVKKMLIKSRGMGEIYLKNVDLDKYQAFYLEKGRPVYDDEGRYQVFTREMLDAMVERDKKEQFKQYSQVLHSAFMGSSIDNYVRG